MPESFSRRFLLKSAGAAALVPVLPAVPSSKPLPGQSPVTLHALVSTDNARQLYQASPDRAHMQRDQAHYHRREARLEVLSCPISGELYRVENVFTDGWTPRHILDVPPGDLLFDGDDVRLVEYVSRAEAMRQAAEFNRQDPSERGDNWAVVVQVGDMIPLRTICVSVLTRGAGFESHEVARPFRVVEATAEELVQLAELVAAVA